MASDLIGRKDVKIGLAVLSGALVAVPIYNYFKRICFERDHPWIEAGKVEELFVYPVKSCRGNKVDSLNCGPLGASNGEDFDRFFLIVDAASNHFYTARQQPALVLLETHVKDNILTLSSRNGEKIDVELTHVVENDVRHVATLHSKLRQEGLDCGESAGKFITEFLRLDKPCRLLYFKEGLMSERTCKTSPKWWNNHPVPKRNDKTAFVDLAPYLALTAESLDDLNARIQETSPGNEKIVARHFRPNIVVSGVPPYDEDRWLEVKIGETEFVCYKPCTRCVMTTVSPEEGTKNPAVQPLRKLREYRLAPDGPMRKEFKQDPIFGVNMGIIKSGPIHEGDKVHIRYKKDPF
ncbi:hypothetical protein L596_023507 [Steinernema carpocapsae]|uniref:MOSC domain-containing protein n=1 Tax=Steinernema carpocapsae TaxID=34508 RepID=A0A4U5MDU2_STECR|nr:hypothetical protein L596_023507 [Steinernema carpocapsae]